jgi:hypothetical protein
MHDTKLQSLGAIHKSQVVVCVFVCMCVCAHGTEYQSFSAIRIELSCHMERHAASKLLA